MLSDRYLDFQPDAFVGAALCCEEAGTSDTSVSSAPASSQHKAAPTGNADMFLEQRSFAANSTITR
ncbi:protein of unknown function [Pseudomonas sp. JV551A1]|nr:protein of unknown function [Pseudomonas sp. JV551A1]